MKCLRPIGLILTISALAHGMPPDVTSTRLPMGETIKQLQSQLMEQNATEMMTFDTRTPPKIKQQQQQHKKNAEAFESSHAGIAIPVDEDSLELEETNKKMNFYKIERPTTNSGLSTWILLSGQSETTTKPTRRPIVKNKEEEKYNKTLIQPDPPKLAKPIFKIRTTTTTKRPSTMKNIKDLTTKPSTTRRTTSASTTTTTTKTTTKPQKEQNKLTNKIKASVLTSAVNKKNASSTTPLPMKKIALTTNTTTKKYHIYNTTEKLSTKNVKTTTEPSKTSLSVTKNNTVNAIDSNALSPEAKDEEVELPSNNNLDSKKKKNNKRKKNKNRRRKPAAAEKIDNNSTKIEKQKVKEKPIGTQLYNYLSREVMPTVGVGLVGLMVTAGLAGYFLYPFGIARRTFEVDRKDKEGSYYYSDAYSGGMPEEEAIGKVIAGMPANTLYGNFKSSTRNSYNHAGNNNNLRYRQVDRRTQIQSQSLAQGTVETVPAYQNYESTYHPIPPNYKSDYQPVSYKDNEQTKETVFRTDDKKFVVGSIPKEILQEATPAAVPEHGPRSLKIRRRRDLEDNEINYDESTRKTDKNEETTAAEEAITTFVTNTTEEPVATTTTKNDSTQIYNVNDKYSAFINLFKDLVHLKLRMGLQLIHNATETISRYISRVQTRLDDHFRTHSRA